MLINDTDYIKNFNNLHDDFRNKLANQDVSKFPRFGPHPVAVVDILSALCHDNELGRQMTCLSCDKQVVNLFPQSLYPFIWSKHAQNLGFSSNISTATIQNWTDACLASCNDILHPLNHHIVFSMPPTWLWFEVWNEVVPKTIPTISLNLSTSSGNVLYHLTAIIYSGTNHFTCSFLDSELNLWFHDGQKNNGNPQLLGKFSDVNELDFIELNGRTAHVFIYQRT
jgi:hypothetical protein